MDIFSYEFMNRAFIAGILLGIIIPTIGLVVVLKRMSMIGDALSHTSLAGVAIGLVAGFNPIVGAVALSVISALIIELIRRKFPYYSELAIAIVMSAGVGLTGILSGYGSNASSLSSYMFGSIVAITNIEMLMIMGVSIIVLIASILLYKELFYISLDERGAIIAGVPVKTTNFIFTILTALTVAIASKTVGALVVSSLMVIPVAIAMQLCRSYKKTLMVSIICAVIFTIIGLFLSFYIGLRPGGTIVLTGVVALVIVLVYKGASSLKRVKENG